MQGIRHNLNRNHERQLLKPDDEGGHMKGAENHKPDCVVYGFRHHAEVMPDKDGKDGRHHWQIWRHLKRRFMYIEVHVSWRGALGHEWDDR